MLLNLKQRLKPRIGRAVRSGFLLSVAIALFPTSAAMAASTSSAWLVHDWELNDGLPNNNITGVAETADGYLWVANRGNLVRFDGVSFEEFSTTNYIPGAALRGGLRAL